MQLAAAEQHRSRVGMSISAMHQGEDLLTAEQVKATQAARAHNRLAHEEAVQLQAKHRWEATEMQGCIPGDCPGSKAGDREEAVQLQAMTGWALPAIWTSQ